MPTLKVVVGVLHKDDFVVSLDLSDTYFQLCINSAFHRFLRFNLQSPFYPFQAMPFCLCLAPNLFTMLTHAITQFCWQQGICIISYLDDTIMARS